MSGLCTAKTNYKRLFKLLTILTKSFQIYVIFLKNQKFKNGIVVIVCCQDYVDEDHGKYEF